MSTHALAGLAIAVDDAGAGALDAFFRALAPIAARPDIALRLGKTAAQKRSPIYFLGVVQVYAADVGYLLETPTHRATVSRELIVLDADPSAPFAEGIAHAALLLALRLHGRYELHAAAIATPDDHAVLIVGDAGAGKTTTLLALAEAEFPWLGDDRVILEGAVVHGYPRALHLGPATLDMFPRLRALAAAPEGREEKRRVDARAALPHGFRSRCLAPKAIVLPRIDRHEPTAVFPASRADAFGALVEAAAIALVDGVPGRDEHLELLRAIENKANAWVLRLGPDALADRGVIVRVLEQAGVLA